MMNIRTSPVKHIYQYTDKASGRRHFIDGEKKNIRVYTTRSNGEQFHLKLGKRACEKLILVTMIDNDSNNQMKSTTELMIKEMMLK